MSDQEVKRTDEELLKSSLMYLSDALDDFSMMADRDLAQPLESICYGLTRYVEDILGAINEKT